MDRLPLEIQQEIFRYCSWQDASNARLVCHTWAVSSAHVVFARYKLRCYRFSFETLAQIAHSPYGQHLRHIVVDTSQLMEQSRPEFYKRLQDTAVWKAYLEQHRPESVDPVLSTTYRTYRNLRQQQQGLLLQLSYREMLREALAALPHLNKLEFPTHATLEYGSRAFTEDRLAFIRCFKIEMRDVDDDPNSWFLAAVLDALGQRSLQQRHQVNSLHIYWECSSSFLAAEKVAIGSSDIDQRLSAIEGMMEHIEDLTIGLTPVRASPEQRIVDNEVKNLLKHCTERLRSLHLDRFRGYNLADKDHKPFTDVFKTAKWPRLHTLILSANLHTKDMLAFMHNHGGLKTLMLYDIAFDDVEAVLADIPRSLKLTTIYVHNLYSWQVHPGLEKCYFPLISSPGDAAMKWLLGQREEMPQWTLESDSFVF